MVDDVVEGFEDSVGEPILAHELPDVLLAVELGRARRQRQQRDVARDLQLLRSVTSSLGKDDDGMGARANLAGDLVEMKLHGFAVAEGQNQCRAGSELRAHGTE